MVQKKQKLETPYSKSYELLENHLRLLKGINEQLPKSIEKLREDYLEEWGGRLKNKEGTTLLAVGSLTKWMIELEPRLDKGEDPQSLRKELRPLLKSAPSDARKLARDLSRAAIRFSDFFQFIREMSLVWLVSRFEGYLQAILEASFRKWPLSIGKEKILTYEQLIRCVDIQDAKSLIVRKEISNIMREDIDSIDKYISRKWKVIPLSKCHDWKDFRERFYRRNIIIHNEGMPDDNYRHKVDSNAKDQLVVSTDYLMKSMSLFAQMSKKLTVQFNAKL